MQTKIYLEYKAKTLTPNKYGKQNTKRKKEPHQKQKKTTPNFNEKWRQ